VLGVAGPVVVVDVVLAWGTAGRYQLQDIQGNLRQGTGGVSPMHSECSIRQDMAVYTYSCCCHGDQGILSVLHIQHCGSSHSSCFMNHEL
jgi:hypothetical protein